ncbi:MAG: TetR/AcrR family transcriptional regulator [Acidimicrobiales bacterium]|nr:TetR/AcrR family transcriptional regulator [Acidimicrobiales bacterium]
MGQDTGQPEESLDGRRRRRLQGRRSAIDATIDLVLEGKTMSADAVCERAGISPASLFRYFDTLDDLRTAAIARYFERFDDLFSVPDIGEGSIADRIRRFVSARDDLYLHTAPMARFSRHQAVEVDEMAETLTRVRATLSDQIDRHFAAELDHLSPAVRARRVAVLAALTSFEAWDQLATLTPEARRSALVESVGSILGIG